MVDQFLTSRFIQDQRFAPFGSIANRAHHIAIRIGMIREQAPYEELLKGRTGGYLCVAESDTGNPHFTLLLGGPVDQQSLPKYYEHSSEKARRLSRNPTHLSSYQSRDGVDRWGGAIRTTHGLIFSFSGFPELVDEALVLTLLMLEVQFNTPELIAAVKLHCDGIADLSDNTFYHTLLRHCAH